MDLAERLEPVTLLGGLLAECAERNGNVVLLDGPTASGKTEILRHLADQAVLSGALFLGATCCREESSVAYGVLSQLVKNPAMPAPMALRMSASLDAAMHAAKDVSDMGGAASGRPDVFHELYAALFDLGDQRPVIVGIDDIQYSDVPSLRFLTYLARRLRLARIMLTVSCDANQRLPHRQLLAELPRVPHFRHVRLPLLSPRGIADLVTAELGQQAARRVMGDFAALSGGNPLLVKALIEDYQSAAQTPGQHYGLALLSCLYRGEPHLVKVARALAVLGDDSSPAELAEPAEINELAGVDNGTVDQALRAMTDAGLLDGMGLFRHPAARAAVLDDLPPQQRSELHQQAAHLRHGQGAAATVVARHLLEADQARRMVAGADEDAAAPAASGAPWVVDVLAQAGEHGLLTGQLRLAADCLRLAHRSCAGEPAQVVLRARLAQAEWQLNPSAAARHLSSLVAAARAGGLADPDRVAMVRQLLWHGHADEAVEVLNGLRTSADGTQAQPQAQAQAAPALRATERWLTCSFPPLARRRQAQWAPAAVEDAGLRPDTDPCLQSAGLLADIIVTGRSREKVDRVEQVLRDLPLTRSAAWAQDAALLALLALVCADRADIAVRWSDELLAAAGTWQAPTWQAIFASARAEAALRQGDLRTAVRYARAALEHVRPNGWGVALGLPLGSLILASTRLGDYTDAAQYLTHRVNDAMFKSRYGLHYLYARGHYYLATNHCHAALADFLSCGELIRAWSLDAAGLVPWRTSAAEAWIRLGNEDRAKRLIHDELASPGAGGASARGFSLRILAMVSPAARRLPLLDEALELFEACGDWFGQAGVLTELSRTHQALHDKRSARLAFRRASHMAEMCGSAALRKELFSIAGDTTAPSLVAGDGMSLLSGSEHRVASLAVIGYTNAEIATRLHVTPSTVEQHLTRVYRKLRVKGRKNLPADLGADLAGHQELS